VAKPVVEATVREVVRTWAMVLPSLTVVLVVV